MILLWSSFSDYTNGLESNLVAEMVGLVVSVVVTYLIVDRIVQGRLEAQNRPLLARLRARIDYSVAMMAFSWGVVLGVAHPADAATASQGAFVPEIDRRINAHSSASELADEVRSRHAEAPLLIGTFTVENVARVITLSDRLSHVTSNDITLESLLTDLDAVVEDIDIAVRHWGRIEAVALPGSEVDLVELSRAAFNKALALKTYADAHL
jgi:hypothetical protein